MRKMLRSKGGQWVFAGIMIAVMVIIVITQLVAPLKTVIVTARGAGGLDCDNAAISAGTQMACIVVDTYLFYFLGMVFVFAMAYIFNKKRVGKEYD